MVSMILFRLSGAVNSEEIEARNAFYTLHSVNLPDDLCLSITNLPTKWEVRPISGESLEVLPEVENDLIEQVSMILDAFCLCRQ